jgi:hypothetical protein
VRHLVIAGTRDTGLMQAAENLAAPDALQELARGNPALSGFEALYEVHGVNGVNVDSRLIKANATHTVPTAP